MPQIPRRVALVLAGVAAVLVAACGSSGGNSGNGGVGTGGHDSPENATRGFINALSGFNGSSQSLTPVLDWISPSSRSVVQQGLSSIPAGQGSIKFFFQNVNVGSAAVSSDGVHASVPVGGGLCVAYSASGLTESTSCSSGTSIGKDAVPCVKENGQWYVDGALFGGGSSSSSTSSVAGGASSDSSSTSTTPSTDSTSSSSSS